MSKLSLLLLLLGVCASLVIGVTAKHLLLPQYYTGNCGATQNEGEVLTLGCDSGFVIKSVDFASYGNAGGDCQQGFTLGSCHADSSVSVVAAACVGKNQCSVTTSNDNFGGDPCYGTYKHLAAKVTCRPTTDYNCGSAGEGQSVTLSCADRKFISNINFASYGTVGGVCPNYKKGSCHSSNSFSVVSSQCIGKTSCSVVASNANFGGDPCPGSVKALAINVTCTVGINIDYTCGIQTEGDPLSFSCGEGKVISMINFASYGTPTGTCKTNFAKSSCHAPNSLSVVAAQCLNKVSCQVTNSNDNFGGDPCYGYVKQLAGKVTCSLPAPAEVTCATAGEGQMMTLSCSAGRKISSINFASYGNPGGTCPNPSVGSCHSPSSQSVVEAACLGKQMCSVAASNAAFGEPCYLTVKKLVASATCA